MKLNIAEWKEFQIGRLFDVILSTGDLKIADCDPGEIPLISSGQTNNGIVGYINKKGDGKAQLFSGGKITVDMFCNAFYQDKDFYSVSHGRVNILSPKFKADPSVLLFICTLINKERYRFSYGRALYSKEVEKMIIKLPVCKDENNNPVIDPEKKYSDNGYIPDFEYIKEYIERLRHKPLVTKNKVKQKPRLDIDKWEEFRVGDIFDKVKVKKFSATPEIEGDIPYISSTSSNNGVSAKVCETPIKGNCITVSTNGSCFDAFYHKNPIVVSSDVEVLYSDKLNEANAIFLCTVLRQEKFRYSYGRKPKSNKVFDTVIKLPICRDENGNPIIDPKCQYSKKGYIPDFKFMEEYIKSLPYGDKLKKSLK